MYYAFKNAQVAGSMWSKAIAWKTGGLFSHVELWLSGPQDKALCFSSREGEGCSLKVLDLTVKGLWVIEPAGFTPDQELKALGYALAMSAAKVRYDYLGILGIGTGHGEHDDHDRFCSEVCIEVAQQCAGRWLNLHRWLVSPSALYQLVKGVPA